MFVKGCNNKYLAPRAIQRRWYLVPEAPSRRGCHGMTRSPGGTLAWNLVKRPNEDETCSSEFTTLVNQRQDMTWTVASDIAHRVKNLREFLGGGSGRPVLQEDLARRVGVRTSQISQWERGAQRPSRNRLERWADREGWPIEMFQEGAPMPAKVLAPSPSSAPQLGRGSSGPGHPPWIRTRSLPASTR